MQIFRKILILKLPVIFWKYKLAYTPFFENSKQVLNHSCTGILLIKEIHAYLWSLLELANPVAISDFVLNTSLLITEIHVYLYLCRVECGNFFLIGQNRSTYLRSGMILEVQIQNFGARPRTRVKLFIFEKFQGAKYQYFNFILLIF